MENENDYEMDWFPHFLVDDKDNKTKRTTRFTPERISQLRGISIEEAEKILAAERKKSKTKDGKSRINYTVRLRKPIKFFIINLTVVQSLETKK